MTFQNFQAARKWILLGIAIVFISISSASVIRGVCPLPSDAEWAFTDGEAARMEEYVALGDMAAVYNPALTLTDRVEIGQAVSRHSAANGLDPMLVMAVIVVESGGNPGAVSPKGATGLMQVMPWHVDDFGGNADLTDIDDNIRIGTFILADNMRRWGHNAGIQRYFWGTGQPDGRYLAKVLKAMEALNG